VALDWRLWAPPLDPPTEGGLPEAAAQQIAGALWDDDPWLCLALMWEAYALTLAPEPAVASVSTGAQSVSYAAPGGPFGLAMARAQWFRDQRGSLGSVPLRLRPPPPPLPFDWWQRNYDDPATWEGPP
jgi:hypothetical protein